MRFSEIKGIAGGEQLQLHRDAEVTSLVVDSRKALVSEGSVFFAIAGDRHDGHEYISGLYKLGIRQFIIEKPIDIKPFPEGNFLSVKSTLRALQKMAIHHRLQFNIPVIGITGSNAKTIIKEWLYQLLSPDRAIVKNPGSYNSQLGVPLAVWQMLPHHSLGIFEAGISRPGEMENLQPIIQPSIGLLTNMGPAHDEGFKDRAQKIEEKLKLFSSVDSIVYCKDQLEVAREIEKRLKGKHLSWGADTNADIRIIRTRPDCVDVITAKFNFQVSLPFSDSASVENVCHCIAMMIHLGIEPVILKKRILQLKAVPMRLELKQGINQSQIIDDTYNNDLAGLQISLDFLGGLQHKQKIVILSDLLQTGLEDIALVKSIAQSLGKAGVNKLIAIGSCLTKHRSLLESVVPSSFYKDTASFLANVDWNEFTQQAILVKGARVFQFEKIVQRLQKKIHGTVMEIDLGAMVDNLNLIKSKLHPGVKLMVMVKAFAYGSGSEEVASLLQYHKVDYLGVAYADEGVELRNNHITLPIMVMNPSEESFANLLEYDLEPEVYSLSLLKSLSTFLNGKPCRIHLKLDTGMHRLGLEEGDAPELMEVLNAHGNIQIASVFSHLAGADESAHDEFTEQQVERFRKLTDKITSQLKSHPIRHILNSSGIIRFPALQFEMVRLGIGLYGIDPTGKNQFGLKPVATLKTIISQIKKVKSGETIGYGRHGKATGDMIVATIAIGYADGFSRMFSKGVGSVLLHGKLAPVTGNVCMDMTMIDITAIPEASEGDEVIVFGGQLSIHQVAASIHTIPYEILTSTSERVKRVFYAESI